MIPILSKDSLVREALYGFESFEKYVRKLEMFSTIDLICSDKIEQFLQSDTEGKMQIWKDILSWDN